MLESLLEQFGQGDRRALARLLSLVSRGQRLDQILAKIPHAPKASRVVAITGSAGVGKSTLVGKLLASIRASGLKVAVLACDPQSPLSGGALLGDRFRMPSQVDEGLFIRSLAALSGRGAVAEHLDAMVRLLEAFGFDVILIETVGAGQGDTAVHALADVVVLLLQPEAGDDLQWEKAGLLEIADIIVIHKADLPGADRVEAQVRASLEAGHQVIPVLRVSASKGQGLNELWQAISACPLRRAQTATAGRELLHLAQNLLAVRFACAENANDPKLERLLGDWQGGNLEPETAGAALLQLLVTDHASV